MYRSLRATPTLRVRTVENFASEAAVPARRRDGCALLVILVTVGDEERAGVNWVQVTAAALAAMSSAVLLSTLGVAGTIVGAAVGSLTASVGGALYSRGIHASRQQAATLKRVAQARADVDKAAAAMRRGEAGSETTLRRADRALGDAEVALEKADDDVETSDGDAGSASTDGDERAVYGAAAENQAGEATESSDPNDEARKLPWKRIALISAGVFVAAMVAITAFELATGRPVSTFTGGSDADTGTTIPGLGNNKDSAPDDEPKDGEPTGGPSDDPSTDPSAEPSEPTEPTADPTVLPSETATPTPTPAQEPTASESPPA